MSDYRRLRIPGGSDFFTLTFYDRAEAVLALRAPFDVWSRETEPHFWSMGRNNLGNALRSLGERESGTDRLAESVQAQRAALAVISRQGAPLHWARSQRDLGNALRVLGERESSLERLAEAESACRAALEVLTREAAPLDWADTQWILARIHLGLGERSRDPAALARAREEVQEARDMYRALDISRHDTDLETLQGKIVAVSAAMQGAIE